MNHILVLATRNKKKRRELEQLLADLPISVRSLEEYPDAPEVDETGATFEENATLKASAIAAATGEWTLADDSGLEVDALDGRPGVFSARFSGEGATDEGNRRLVLEWLEGVPVAQRGARFVCVIALSSPAGELTLQEGTCEGRIRFAEQGEYGFGYDPIFEPEGFQCTMAELATEDKHRISHRGKALAQIRPSLEALARAEAGAGAGAGG